jgi:hypothetical protein
MAASWPAAASRSIKARQGAVGVQSSSAPWKARIGAPETSKLVHQLDISCGIERQMGYDAALLRPE